MTSRVLALVAAAGRRFVALLDALVRRAAGIFEFSDDPACLLRLGLARSHAGVVLSDGTVVRPGDWVGQFHLWNEHIPRMEATGPDLTWGVKFYRGMMGSLRMLTTYVEADGRFTSVPAFHGEVAVLQEEDVPAAVQLFKRLGFDTQEPQAPTNWLWRFVRFWEGLYTWWLMWAYQPASLQRRSFRHLVRFDMWISRTELLRRFGSGKEAGTDAMRR
ncbi:MAG: hypothetical protein ACE5F6_16885 [Anaerolineae bacterium]